MGYRTFDSVIDERKKKNAAIFRQTADCTMMEDPYNVAVVSCAALNLDGKYSIKLTAEGHMPQEALDITRCKIRTIFRIGLLHGHDALILGAFGCGAFHNPPEEVARLFHEVMEEEEFKNKFKCKFSLLSLYMILQEEFFMEFNEKVWLRAAIKGIRPITCTNNSPQLFHFRNFLHTIAFVNNGKYDTKENNTDIGGGRMYIGRMQERNDGRRGRGLPL